MATVRVRPRTTVRLNAAERRALEAVIQKRQLPSVAAAVRLGIGMFLREEKIEGFAGRTDEELGFEEGVRQGIAKVQRAMNEALTKDRA